MVDLQIKIDGMPELERKLSEYTNRMRDRAERGALRSAQAPVLKKARENARPRAGLFKKAMRQKLPEADLVYLALVEEMDGNRRKYKGAPRTKAVKYQGEFITAPQELYDKMVKTDLQIIGDADAPKASRGRKRATALEKGIISRIRVNQREASVKIGLSHELLSGGRRARVYTQKLNKVGFFSTFGSLREPARPFLEPALESEKDKAVENYRNFMRNYIEKQGV